MENATIVIDVPESATTDSATQALSAPDDNYFLVQVLPVPGAHRAYFRRYKQKPTKAEAAKNNAGAADDVVALSVLRANRKESVRSLVSLLAAAGVARGRQWVCDELTTILTEDGREDEALAFLKTSPNDAPEDVVYMLRAVHRIKRNLTWVRAKREEMAQAVRADKS